MIDGPRTRRYGFSLSEVLVALSILALNVLGWSASLSLALALVRRISDVGSVADPAETASSICALALLVPRMPGLGTRSVRLALPTGACGRPRPGGFSLVEVLVALAIGVTVLSGIAAMLAGTSRAVRFASQSADAHTVRSAIPMLVADTVEAAGRGVEDSCGMVTTVGGAWLAVRRALTDGTVTEEEVFAGLDGAGRPALYLRRVPHARQPWVEDVTAFLVERIDFEPYTLAPARASSITLLVEHDALNGPLLFDVQLPHRPCVEAPP